MSSSGSDSTDNSSLNPSVGDRLIYFGRVHEVVKIESKDKADKVVLEPVYKKKVETSLVCKLPADKLDTLKIRSPFKKDKLSELFGQLQSIEVTGLDDDKSSVEAAFYSDEIKPKARLFKQLWMAKQEGSFSFSKKRLWNDLNRILAEEIALVLGLDLEDGEKKLQAAVA